MVQSLITAKAPVNHGSPLELRPLNFAIQSGLTGVVRLLLNARASPTALQVGLVQDITRMSLTVLDLNSGNGLHYSKPS